MPVSADYILEQSVLAILVYRVSLILCLKVKSVEVFEIR